jgi:hypothetical protein
MVADYEVRLLVSTPITAWHSRPLSAPSPSTDGYAEMRDVPGDQQAALR